jgi:hypothetical protein
MLLLFTNPLVIMLLIVSIVSVFVGEIVNASIIALMVVVSIVINFVQTWHSQRAAERLRGQVAPTATILRDGQWSESRPHSRANRCLSKKRRQYKARTWSRLQRCTLPMRAMPSFWAPRSDLPPAIVADLFENEEIRLFFAS